MEALTDAELFVRFNALGAPMSMRPLDARCAEWLQHVATNDEAHPQWGEQDALLLWDNAERSELRRKEIPCPRPTC